MAAVPNQDTIRARKLLGRISALLFGVLRLSTVLPYCMAGAIGDPLSANTWWLSLLLYRLIVNRKKPSISTVFFLFPILDKRQDLALIVDSENIGSKLQIAFRQVTLKSFNIFLSKIPKVLRLDPTQDRTLKKGEPPLSSDCCSYSTPIFTVVAKKPKNEPDSLVSNSKQWTSLYLQYIFWRTS